MSFSLPKDDAGWFNFDQIVVLRSEANSLKDITPVLDLLHPNCPECCPGNEISIVDHIIFAIQTRETKMVSSSLPAPV